MEKKIISVTGSVLWRISCFSVLEKKYFFLLKIGAVYLTSPGRPTDIGLQLGKACYPCSG